MNKEAPSLPRIMAMVVFSLSCFGILLFLWLSFGGATPLKPKGYQIHVHFPEATTLAQEADVRLAGVSIGKVHQKTLDKGGATTNVTLQIDPKYSPLPSNTRAILRQKTLLGETYVELTPGTRSAKRLTDGGTLARSQVEPPEEPGEVGREGADVAHGRSEVVGHRLEVGHERVGVLGEPLEAATSRRSRWPASSGSPRTPTRS